MVVKITDILPKIIRVGMRRFHLLHMKRCVGVKRLFKSVFGEKDFKDS
jgi:hypothetical protein